MNSFPDDSGSAEIFPLEQWPTVRIIHAPPHNVIQSAAFGDAQLRLIREPLISFVPKFTKPTVSIGYFQSASEVPPGTGFVRRLTGGGLVDAENGYSISAMVPPNHPRFVLSPDELHITFSQAVATALAEVGFPVSLAWDAAAFQPQEGETFGACFEACFRFDLVRGGRKVAAGSYYRSATGLMQEMGIHLDQLDATRTGVALVRNLTPLYGVAPRESEVTMTERRLAEILFFERYNTTAWNHAR